MRKRSIFKTFREFQGSGSWAAAKLGVNKATISQWLNGKKTSARLDAEMPQLARQLQATKGACIREDASMVRSQIGKIRRGK